MFSFLSFKELEFSTLEICFFSTGYMFRVPDVVFPIRLNGYFIWWQRWCRNNHRRESINDNLLLDVQQVSC